MFSVTKNVCKWIESSTNMNLIHNTYTVSISIMIMIVYVHSNFLIWFLPMIFILHLKVLPRIFIKSGGGNQKEGG